MQIMQKETQNAKKSYLPYFEITSDIQYISDMQTLEQHKCRPPSLTTTSVATESERAPSDTSIGWVCNRQQQFFRKQRMQSGDLYYLHSTKDLIVASCEPSSCMKKPSAECQRECNVQPRQVAYTCIVQYYHRCSYTQR